MVGFRLEMPGVLAMRNGLPKRFFQLPGSISSLFLACLLAQRALRADSATRVGHRRGAADARLQQAIQAFAGWEFGSDRRDLETGAFAQYC